MFWANVFGFGSRMAAAAVQDMACRWTSYEWVGIMFAACFARPHMGGLSLCGGHIFVSMCVPWTVHRGDPGQLGVRGRMSWGHVPIGVG